MEDFNQENQLLGLPAQGMGVGINSGDVIVGNIGSDRRMKYGVVGSPVNLAARIESFTVAGQVLISESTLVAVGPILRVDGHLRVKVKGYDDPISIYEVGGIGGDYSLYLPEPQHLSPDAL
jgi:adenylate cyclase